MATEATYDSWGCTEKDLALMFPKGTKVELSYRNYSGWKTCSVFLHDFDSDEYDAKLDELISSGNGRLYNSWKNMFLGSFEIEVGEIFGDVVINNGWDAKRYAKQLCDRLGWEWEMIQMACNCELIKAYDLRKLPISYRICDCPEGD